MSPVDPVPLVSPVPVADAHTSAAVAVAQVNAEASKYAADKAASRFKPTKMQLIVAGVVCLLFTGFFFLLMLVAAAVYFLRPGPTPSATPAPAPLINIDPNIVLPSPPKLPLPAPKSEPAPKLPPKPCLHPPFNIECPYCHGVFKVNPSPTGAVPQPPNPKVSNVPGKVQNAPSHSSSRLESYSWRGSIPGDRDPCRPDSDQHRHRSAGLTSYLSQGCRPPRFGPFSGEPA